MDLKYLKLYKSESLLSVEEISDIIDALQLKQTDYYMLSISEREDIIHDLQQLSQLRDEKKQTRKEAAGMYSVNSISFEQLKERCHGSDLDWALNYAQKLSEELEELYAKDDNEPYWNR